MIEITREIATKVRDIVDAGLIDGVGVAVPGKMCVEAAVCFALGLPHGDDPGCVAPSLRRLKIRLNDSRWSSPSSRSAGLRRLAIAQLGSLNHLDEQEFRDRVVDVTIRRVVPIGLRAAARLNPKFSADLEAAAVRCEQEGTREAALEAKSVARKAYAAAAYAAAAADAAAAARTRDRVLAQYAEWIVEILIDMNAPGCAYLDLVPKVA